MGHVSYPSPMVRVEAVPPRPARPGERERLIQYTGRSRRLQRRLRGLLLASPPIVIALMVAGLDGTVVLAVAATLGIVVGVGFWITSGHIREWGERLREIERAGAAAQVQVAASEQQSPFSAQPGSQ
jgi:hypothetical protein